MKKKAIAVLLALVLIIALVPAAYAASSEAIEAADTLHALGLFQGKGTNPDDTPIYALDDAPTRMEAITMLVRLLGKEEEANAGTWEIPFTDVAPWAIPYVGYAYANGLTKGTGSTTFGGTDYVTATQYLTFILRALGYDSSKDFKWDAAWELTDQLGITHGEYNADNNRSFLRGDVAEISADALSANLKDASATLAEKLIGENVFTAEQYKTVTGQQDDEAQQTEEEDDSEEAPFTETAFGDKALHEYLMTLGPSEVNYGPQKSLDYFDMYLYRDQFIADEITKTIKEMYTFVQTVPPAENGAKSQTNYFGTRITTMEHAVYGRGIFVQTFSEDGYVYGMDYYIRARTDR